ncbi:MAG: InlB B-repeat-containing protein [Kiritimatiellae bacterium]|nr:InlB B-repeat-containing protein [Kiritimatiellia bacterium]
MKLTLTRVLTPLAALAIAFGAQAALPANEGFEGAELSAGWTFTAGPDEAADKSAITAYADGETLPANRPDAFDGADNNNYLKLSTEDGILFRQVNEGAVQEIPNTGLYLDTVVQFTVTDKSDRPTPTSEDKFIIWLEADEANQTTNLCVYAGQITSENPSVAPAQFVYTLKGIDIAAGSWHRLTVKAAADIFPKSTYDMAGFQIYIDGNLATTEDPILVGDAEDAHSGTGFLADDDDVVTGGAFFPSMVNAAELKLVGFSGEGKIDDVVITDQLPGVFPHETLTLTWDSTMVTSVTVLGKTYAQSPAVINVEAGQVITLAKTDFGFVGAPNKYQFLDWEATVEDIEVADTATDVRTITVGASGSVALAFEASTKFDITIGLGALDELELWDDVTEFGYTIGAGDFVDLTDSLLDGEATIEGVEPGQTVTVSFVLDGYTASLTTDAANVRVNGLVLEIGDKADANFSATLVLEAPAAKVFKVGETEYTLAQIGDALAASTATTPVTLMDDVDLEAAIEIANEAEAYIDLAGNTLTGAEGANVFTIAGALTITNSVTGGGIEAAEGQAIASNIAGTLTIDGDADYVGAITKDAGTININAGSFSTDVAATFATGYGLTYDDDAEMYVYGALTYTITFNANDGEGSMSDQTYTVNSEDFTLTANAFTKADKKFAGWATSESAGVKVYDDEAKIVKGSTGDLELFAVWTDAAEEYPPYIDESDADAKKKYDDWVAAYGIADHADAGAVNQKAYLLNVAPANAEAAEKKFVITSITLNEDGTVTVKTPNGPAEGLTYNGTVEIWGCETVKGEYSKAKFDAKTAKFFKAILK